MWRWGIQGKNRGYLKQQVFFTKERRIELSLYKMSYDCEMSSSCGVVTKVSPSVHTPDKCLWIYVMFEFVYVSMRVCVCVCFQLKMAEYVNINIYDLKLFYIQSFNKKIITLVRIQNIIIYLINYKICTVLILRRIFWVVFIPFLNRLFLYGQKNNNWCIAFVFLFARQEGEF